MALEGRRICILWDLFILDSCRHSGRAESSKLTDRKKLCDQIQSSCTARVSL